MNEKEHLCEIQRMIELLLKEGHLKEIEVIKDFVDFRKGHSTPELKSLGDIFYFLCGILLAKGLTNYWNGRRI